MSKVIVTTTINAPTLCSSINCNASNTEASGPIERTQNPLPSNMLLAFMAIPFD